MKLQIVTSTKGEKLAALMQSFVTHIRPWLITFPMGYLLGRIVNATSDTTSETIVDILINVFTLSKSVNILSWICIILPIIYIVIWIFVRYHKRLGRAETLLASLAHNRIEPSIKQFLHGTLAWESNITLQLAPDLQMGWPVDQVEAIYDGSMFTLPSNELRGYEDFMKTNSDRFMQDGNKYMLIRNPVVFSDMPKLTLEIQKTKFSIVRYYQEHIITLQSQRNSFLRNVFEDNEIEFPNSLCMHAVVITKDKKILITERSSKVAYSPKTWSVSVEEQLSEDDFRQSAKDVVMRWAQRLLLEELAVNPTDYGIDNLRILSVFIEADIMNCSVSAALRLNLSSSELDSILMSIPRTDYEFSKWLFISYSDLATELKAPTRLYHPSSGYRSLLALANRYGAARVADKLFSMEPN